MKKVGSLWFDLVAWTRLGDCNYVVVSSKVIGEKDPQKTYYVLVIREKAGSGRYETLGVGMVEAQFVSSDCVAGTLW